jgi:dTDP-4-amino-4,6-dideoxygalactose transaminase
MEYEIPFYVPFVGREEEEALKRVIRSKWLTQGPEVEAFEAEAAAFLGAPERFECVAVSSGTAALYMLIEESFREEFHRVHLPTLTFAATINAVLANGLKPVICDVSANGILSEMGSQNVMVSFGGKIPIGWTGKTILDQAHSFQPGAFHDRSAWSFYSNKNIGCGEGGLIGCHEQMASILKAKRDHGRVGKYEVAYPGSLNFRMSEIQAAVLREQLKKSPLIFARKRAISNVYRSRLEGVEGLILPPDGVFHLFWIRVVHHRDLLKDCLAEWGIETSVHYKPLHQMEAFKRWCGDRSFPIADLLANETLSLPFWPGLEEDQAHFICDKILETELVG